MYWNFTDNEIIIFRFDDHNIPGVPDGMTIDIDGNLWVATFNTMVNLNFGFILLLLHFFSIPISLGVPII